MNVSPFRMPQQAVSADRVLTQTLMADHPCVQSLLSSQLRLPEFKTRTQPSTQLSSRSTTMTSTAHRQSSNSRTSTRSSRKTCLLRCKVDPRSHAHLSRVDQLSQRIQLKTSHRLTQIQSYQKSRVKKSRMRSRSKSSSKVSSTKTRSQGPHPMSTPHASSTSKVSTHSAKAVLATCPS